MLDSTRQVIRLFDATYSQKYGRVKNQALKRIALFMASDGKLTTDDITRLTTVRCLIVWLLRERNRLVTAALDNAHQQAVTHGDQRLVFLTEWYQTVWLLHCYSTARSSKADVQLQDVIDRLQAVQQHAQQNNQAAHEGMALSLLAEFLMCSGQTEKATITVAASTAILKDLATPDPRVSSRLAARCQCDNPAG